MPKNKDPAVLFYTSDFLVGVMGLTMAERGQYITLLCLQHQKGHLSAKDIELAVGKVSPDVLDKFVTDEDGKYYNEIMESNAKQREAYIESRRNNGMKKHTRPVCNENKGAYATPYANRMEVHSENENENINENINKPITNNLIFPFSKTTTTTEARTREENKEKRVANSEERVEIWDYFKSLGYKSSAGEFIEFNNERGWRGPNGADLLEDYRWMSYADAWELREKQWKSEDDNEE